MTAFDLKADIEVVDFKEQCPVADIVDRLKAATLDDVIVLRLRQPDMAIDETHSKDWRIEVLPDESGWEALVYCPGSPLHEKMVPHGPDRRAVIEDAKALIGRNPTS